MTVQDKAHVKLDYSLTIDSGEVVDRSTPEEPLEFIYGAQQIIPGLEKKLHGMKAGESAKLVVEAAEGYGERNEQLVEDLPRKYFPDGVDVQIGMVFQANTPSGPARMKVLEVAEDHVKADFNHPMAGERLTFDVKVVNVREATEEELEELKAPHTSGGCGGGCSCSD
jgi:FKBP-type peptidyl-prolyl cis-trans isomerase SlyD